MQQVSKHLLNLRRTWIGGNAEGMLKAVTTKNVDSYLRNRKEVLDQIKAFDEELKVTPGSSKCSWCDNTTLNKCWPSDLR